MFQEAIAITLKREGTNVSMFLKVAPEVENYFKELATLNGSVKTETSSKWKAPNGDGLKFYVKEQTMSRRVAQEQVMDNFGNGLFDSERINVALLRTVGASNGITITTSDLCSYEETKEYIKRLAVWTRKFYENYLRASEIKALIGFEV